MKYFNFTEFENYIKIKLYHFRIEHYLEYNEMSEHEWMQKFELFIINNSKWDVCNQCGAKRELWQDPETTFCPNHSLPDPYSSCDGKLKYE